MDFVIEYGEYRPSITEPVQQRDEEEEDREYIPGCLGEPFKNIYTILGDLYEDIVLIFNNMFVEQVEEIQEQVSRPASPARTPTPQMMVADLNDMPEVSPENREQYSKLIDYLQNKIIGMELTLAEQEINMVNPRVKLYTEMYNDVENVSVYVTIDDKGRITSIDRDGKIIAEFCVE